MFDWLNKLNPLAPIGAGLRAHSAADAKNRGEKLSAQLDLEDQLMRRDAQYQGMNIDREAEGRAGASDAYRKLMSTAHLMNPGARPQLAGPYSAAPRVPGEAELQGAGALQAEVMKRLTGGNPIAPVVPRQVTNNDAAFRVDPRLMDPGKGEKIAGWLGAFL